MSVIYQLSPHVADLIAAGEVVERPGSVVKELVENSIDAGASRVTVEIQNGGMSLIRVTDDGCGMDRTDAQTAFLRHATSKLRKEEDLAAIGTLGFRGEALAAISSVSRIDLLTCTPGSTEGTSLHLEGGVIQACDPAGCPVGTTIVVRDLFYNTPARLKFMKTDLAEGANVTAAMQRLALAHPEISFRLLRDGQEALRTAGDGKLLSAIYTVFGRQSAKDMLPVESSWEKLSVSGFVSKPLATRGNRAGQMFYVNGRFVKSRTLTAALEEAYRNQMMQGRFPTCVLNITIPLGMVDVNVHPAKTEIRFLSEKSVYDSVYYGVLGTLSRASGKKDMELGPAPEESDATPVPAEKPAPEKPAAKPREAAAKAPASAHARTAVNKDFFRQMSTEEFRAMADTMRNTAVPSGEALELVKSKKDRAGDSGPAAPAPLAHGSAAAKKAEETAGAQIPAGPAPEEPASAVRPLPLTEPAPAQQTLAEPETPLQESMPLPEAPSYRIIGEALNCYILVEEGDALLFIDKHAAHERILFEKLRAQEHASMAQQLLSPVSAALSREEAAAVLENRALLRECGFEVEDFGDHTVLLRAIPDDLDETDAEALLAELAEALLSGREPDPAVRRDELLHTIACKAAIKGGWHTEPEEREKLVREVMTRDDLKYCPHGRPICVRMTDRTLRRQFKRIV